MAKISRIPNSGIFSAHVRWRVEIPRSSHLPHQGLVYMRQEGWTVELLDVQGRVFWKTTFDLLEGGESSGILTASRDGSVVLQLRVAEKP